jgi:uncharacterized repeat protein (TIGR03803 family)
MKVRHSLKMFCLLFAIAATIAIAAAQTLKPLVSFNGTNGASPYAGLVQGANGNFYGTTASGGASGGGTVFEITARGKFRTIYNFCSQTNCGDGEHPQGTLVLAANGNFYGTTAAGGANGGGTVFEMSPAGLLKTIYSFCSQANCADGGDPVMGLVQGTNGNFYGTTAGGGAQNYGTVFEITNAGYLKTLHSFCSLANCADGGDPQVRLMQASDGNFYGATLYFGTNCCGTVFKITPQGRLITIHSFDGADGSGPPGGLIQATDGDFYGTTLGGGTNNWGTVFKINSTGTLTTLYNFCTQANCTDGRDSVAALTQATDGNFYGTTQSGGPANAGTVFEITAAGALTTVYDFCSRPGCFDGQSPFAALIQAADGNFYGTTLGGEGGGGGIVFSLSTSLNGPTGARSTQSK